MIIRHTAVDVGTPSNGFQQEWDVITPVHFHGFEGLEAARRTIIHSPEFTCFGHRWRLRIYPGGATNSDDSMVGVFLDNMSKESIEVEWCFTVKNPDGRDVAACDGAIRKSLFAPYSSGGSIWGLPNFAKRSDILSALVAGALVVEVRMMRTGSPVPFIPENPCGKMILKMFMDEESANIVFEVEDGDEQAHVQFHAHRVILKQCAPMLAELCGSGGAPVSITDVKPEIFRHMLCYVYGGKVQEEDLKSHAKDIIEAANRFGVVNLKLEAEASYVKSTTMGVDNVMEHLLYADAMNCALLKETVMDFMLENTTEVIEQVSFEDVPGCLIPDILSATRRKLNQHAEGVDDFNAMRISDLRKKLHEEGLNVDGSRETLIATLKENV